MIIFPPRRPTCTINHFSQVRNWQIPTDDDRTPLRKIIDDHHSFYYRHSAHTYIASTIISFAIHIYGTRAFGSKPTITQPNTIAHPARMLHGVGATTTIYFILARHHRSRSVWSLRKKLSNVNAMAVVLWMSRLPKHVSNCMCGVQVSIRMAQNE